MITVDTTKIFGWCLSHAYYNATYVQDVIRICKPYRFTCENLYYDHKLAAWGTYVNN